MTDASAQLLTGDIDARPLTQHEFEQFRKLAYDQFGLDLRLGKEQLVSARIGKKMRELRLRSYRDYYRYVANDTTGEALAAMIDVLTTNHTSFFREAAHFEFLRQVVLPEIRDRDALDFWSAACSSGEEPYTVAFSVLEELGANCLPKLRILGTDISNRSLAKAERGIYAADRFTDVSPIQLRSYLLRSIQSGKETYLVRKELRSAVSFRRLNLMEQFSQDFVFPVIFCRNVMIYFDRPTQQQVVRRLAACLEPGGYLFIGHAESLNGLDIPLKYVCPSVYRKAGILDPHKCRSL
ncbi:MAG TPA: protein-glutamate O-methyltransferase CheR [Bryobacteraceae bacterium]|nr:protein-glutamate O-methyltransferase CheR [Bryobacteraceae bacterium]